MEYGEILDTRDLIARLEELRGDEDLNDEEREELAALEAVEDAGIADWLYGETLIREDSFTDYARELAEDIGAIDPNAQWPLSHIDWDAAADALKEDYTEVTLDGSTYYVRA